MLRKTTAALIFSLLLVLSNKALAGNDITLLTGFLPSEFEDLSRQVGLAISYTPLAPAEPLGLLGFDIGGEVTAVRIDANSDFWKKAVGKTPPHYLVFPKLHAQKGLPLGFDVGLVYAKAPGSNVGLIGGELKWAVLKGTVVTPAVAVRGDYTKLIGVDDIDMKVYGADVSISKGVGFVTPYAGIGKVWIRSEEKSNLVNLDKVNLSETKGFLGAKISLFVISFVAEADFSKVPSYTGRLNVSF